MLISIVPELDIPLDTIRLSAEVVAVLPPKFMRWWMLSVSLLRPAENSTYRLSLTDEICLKTVHALNLPILDGQAIKRWSE